MRRNTAERAELKASVWDLRLKGVAFKDIAESLNVPLSTVYLWHGEIAKARVNESATALLEVELARLDHWQSQLELQLEEQVARGRTAARTVEVLAKLSERRAKLTGLDAALKVEAQVTEVTQEDLELAELTREAQAAAALEVARVRGEIVVVAELES